MFIITYNRSQYPLIFFYDVDGRPMTEAC